jgi:hypothetical protein
MFLQKLLKTAADDAKQTVERAIEYGFKFSCQLVKTHNLAGDEIQYSCNNEELAEWMKKLFSETFVSKQFNKEELEEMKAKGISPGKSPRDLILVVIFVSDTHINLGVSIPDAMRDHDVDDYVNCIMKEYHNYKTEATIDAIGKFVTAYCTCDFPLKERDIVLQKAFNELKKRKIYIDDDDDVIYDIVEDN